MFHLFSSNISITLFILFITNSFPKSDNDLGKSGPCIAPVVAILQGINSDLPLTSTFIPVVLIASFIFKLVKSVSNNSFLNSNIVFNAFSSSSKNCFALSSKRNSLLKNSLYNSVICAPYSHLSFNSSAKLYNHSLDSILILLFIKKGLINSTNSSNDNIFIYSWFIYFNFLLSNILGDLESLFVSNKEIISSLVNISFSPGGLQPSKTIKL